MAGKRISDRAAAELSRAVRNQQSQRRKAPRRQRKRRAIVAQTYIAKTTTDHADGSSANVDIYANDSGGTKGSETSRKTVSAYNRLGFEITSGNWILIRNINGGFEIISAET